MNATVDSAGKNMIQDDNPVLVENRKFMVKLAENAGEVLQSQRLRYEVFKLEQGHLGSLGGGVDSDRFDGLCRHLLVIDRISGKLAASCRLRSGRDVAGVDDFYSFGEFNIGGLESRLKDTFELGRSCVAAEYRSGAAVAMLWEGIAALRRRFGFSCMLGCASLEHTDAAEGWAVYRYLEKNRFLTDEICAAPWRQCQLPQAEPMCVSEAELVRRLPPLFKAYLRIGAKVCGAPALDSDFGSIDFLIWFDFGKLPERYSRHFGV